MGSVKRGIFALQVVVDWEPDGPYRTDNLKDLRLKARLLLSEA
jgi:hypothetical protein